MNYKDPDPQDRSRAVEFARHIVADVKVGEPLSWLHEQSIEPIANMAAVLVQQASLIGEYDAFARAYVSLHERHERGAVSIAKAVIAIDLMKQQIVKLEAEIAQLKRLRDVAWNERDLEDDHRNKDRS